MASAMAVAGGAQQEALRAGLLDLVPVHGGNALLLQTVNQVVSDSILSWGVAERVRRLAAPNLHYRPTDLANMRMLLLRTQAGPGAGAIDEKHMRATI